MNSFSIASVALAAVLIVPAGSAQARIACDGNFQITKRGESFATPYCQEQNLANVARSYGMRTSVEAIRRSISAKGDICRTIGYDNRVREICLPFRPDGGPATRN